MRVWSLALLLLMMCGRAVVQETPTSTVLFLARDDTDQDGQVTDADNIRLYAVGLDGTVLFVTPPDLHILDYVPAPPNTIGNAAVVAQTPTNNLIIRSYDMAGQPLIETTLNDTAYVMWLTWNTAIITWASRQIDGQLMFTTLDSYTGAISGPKPISESALLSEAPPARASLQLTFQGEPFLQHESLADNLLIVQHMASEPADALWIYDRAEDRLTPFSAWLYTEPLLLATHPQGPRLAILGREFDGSMSLYTIDLSTGVAMPIVTQILSGLIDPPYTAMQWTHDETALLLVGESGDFVVSNMGRIEAVYAFDLATSAFTRLSPEGTLIDRASITSR